MQQSLAELRGLRCIGHARNNITVINTRRILALGTHVAATVQRGGRVTGGTTALLQSKWAIVLSDSAATNFLIPRVTTGGRVALFAGGLLATGTTVGTNVHYFYLNNRSIGRATTLKNC